jgi:uncharacterized protein
MKTFDEVPISEKERKIIRKIRNVIKETLPDSTVILFGSRARGNAAADSDWDVLVLAETVTPDIEERVFSTLFDVELDEDIIVNPLVLPRDEWNIKRYRNHPIHDSVEAEGVLVA